MKKFLQYIAAVKAVAALAFAAQAMLVTVVAMFLGWGSIPISYIWQMIGLALLYGCLQHIAFVDHEGKHRRTAGRLVFLGCSMFIALVGFALVFQWFPAQSPIHWLAFAGLYALAFLTAVFTLRLVFRLGGIRYDQMLAAYKANREEG